MVGPSNSGDLISSLDIGNLLHLQNSDFTSSTIISVKLSGTENYIVWIAAMKLTINTRNKTGFIDGSCVTSSLLSKETLPDVKDAFAIVSRDFVAKTNNCNNNGNKNIDNNKRFRSSVNSGNNRGPNLLCKNYGKVGHTIERYFDLIGYPSGYNKKPGPKQNGSKTFNANSVSTSNENGTTLSFSNEQIMKLINLINEINEVPSGNVQTNMARHPNGTLTKVKYVGNLKLSENVILFDVLVVPEYCVSLLSVNKLFKDNRMFVGFTETKCFIQDLQLNKIVGTGSENGGLYMFDTPSSFSSKYQTLGNHSAMCFVSKSLWHTRSGHPSDMLHYDFNSTKDSQVSPCDICHKAKQTREHFPFSDHQTTTIGELIHLDLWGPYKVVSKDGFRYFLTIVDDYTRVAVKTVRYDNGTEFVNNKMNNLFNSLGIVHQTSCAYTPQQNGIVERKHIHLLNVARSLLFQSGIPLCMWNECILTDAYLINTLTSYVLDGKSPFELVYGFKPKLSHLRSFGYLCFSSILNNSDKFSASKDDSATSMGDNSSSEGNVPFASSGPIAQRNLPENSGQVQLDVKRSSGSVKMPAKFNDYSSEPTSYYEAIKNLNWVEAMNNEIEALNRNNTWTICDLSSRRKVVGSKCKRDGFDYLETFSHVVKMSTVRCMLNVAICNKWDLFQLDINNAFLYGDLSEDVYMTLPHGFDNEKSKVCKLNRSLYGLKQAPMQWNAKLTKALIKHRQSSV
ncbi:putative RNA-directed DNA polymerase [Tanacetum coccineum]